MKAFFSVAIATLVLSSIGCNSVEHDNKTVDASAKLRTRIPYVEFKKKLDVAWHTADIKNVKAPDDHVAVRAYELIILAMTKTVVDEEINLDTVSDGDLFRLGCRSMPKVEKQLSALLDEYVPPDQKAEKKSWYRFWD